MRASILAGTAFLALAACGDAERDADAASNETQIVDSESAAATDASAEGAVPTTAGEFVSMAAASDMYEVEAGKLAQTMGKSDAVKNFGRMMVTDHTKSTADLKAAAGQVQGVDMSPQLTAEHQSDLDALKSAGENFDQVYAQQQVAAHTKALSMLRGFAERGDAEPLKEFAAKTAPVVERHLTEARSLR